MPSSFLTNISMNGGWPFFSSSIVKVSASISYKLLREFRILLHTCESRLQRKYHQRFSDTSVVECDPELLRGSQKPRKMLANTGPKGDPKRILALCM